MKHHGGGQIKGATNQNQGTDPSADAEATTRQLTCKPINIKPRLELEQVCNGIPTRDGSDSQYSGNCTG
jgi:hypothetical protein